MPLFEIHRALRAAAALSLAVPCAAHGGIHRGPGDVVPPGNALRTTTPVRSQFIMCSPGPAPSKAEPIDLTVWDFWWSYRMECYLPTARSAAPLAPSDRWLGSGEVTGPVRLRPSAAQLSEEIAPALARIVDEERDPSLVAGALIALGKIGDVGAEGVDPRALLVDALGVREQTISEAAALALGLLGGDAAVSDALASLAADTESGRRLARRNQVPIRTRVFAAYGLGLCGHRTSDQELRRRIVRALLAVLALGPEHTPDLKVAAVTSLGLVPLPVEQSTGDARRARSREDQIAALLEVFDPERSATDPDSFRWLYRAHAAGALGRLCAGTPEACRTGVANALLAPLAKRSTEPEEIAASCALALGQIGDASDHGPQDLDVRIRRELWRAVEDGMPQTRRYALVSLARCAARPDLLPTGRDAVDEVTRGLVERMRGPFLRPWCGLALGVLCRERSDRGLAPPAGAVRALLAAAEDSKRPAEVSAYWLALGIAQRREARDLLRERLDGRFRNVDEPQAYGALALGLLGDPRDVPFVVERIDRADVRAPLLREGTLALGGFAGPSPIPRLLTSLDFEPRPCVQAAAALALGWTRDADVVAPLLERLTDRARPVRTRAYSAAALGVLCDRAEERWGAVLARELDYRASTTTLSGEGGIGLLGLL